MAAIGVKRSLQEVLADDSKAKQLKVTEPSTLKSNSNQNSPSSSVISKHVPQPKPLTQDELKLRKIVEKRRELRRKVNRQYYESKGHATTIRQFDRVKRIQSEQEELDENLDKMLDTVRELQAKFIKRLEKRDKDIIACKIDPEEPVAKEHARQMTQWLSIVPTLLATYENKKKGEWKLDKNNRDLYQLTTVFNYVDQGNNQGAPDAVPPPPRELPDDVESDSDSEVDLSDDEFESDFETDDDNAYEVEFVDMNENNDDEVIVISDDEEDSDSEDE